MSDRYVDDTQGVLDHHGLWRRIHPTHYQPDNRTGMRRVSSSAFKDSSDGSPMSVALAELEQSTARLRGKYPDEGISKVTARFVRGLEIPQGVHPEPAEDEASHAFVFGRKPPRIRSEMAREANNNMLHLPLTPDESGALPL